jgi:hypothetical protein
MEFKKVSNNSFGIIVDGSVVGNIMVVRRGIVGAIDYYHISYSVKVFGYDFSNVAVSLNDAKIKAEKDYG